MGREGIYHVTITDWNVYSVDMQIDAHSKGKVALYTYMPRKYTISHSLAFCKAGLVL